MENYNFCQYFLGHKLHRIDGPAQISYINGEIVKEEYYLDGIKLWSVPELLKQIRSAKDKNKEFIDVAENAFRKDYQPGPYLALTGSILDSSIDRKIFVALLVSVLKNELCPKIVRSVLASAELIA